MQSSAKKTVDAVMKCFDNSIKKHRETGKKEKLYIYFVLWPQDVWIPYGCLTLYGRGKQEVVGLLSYF